MEMEKNTRKRRLATLTHSNSIRLLEQVFKVPHEVYRLLLSNCLSSGAGIREIMSGLLLFAVDKGYDQYSNL